jgi:hypothetical protein
MRSLIAMIVLAPALFVFPAACGGSSAASGQYGDKCELACKPPAGPCGSQDPADCQQACVTATEGLVVACAQCIAEHSGWSGETCTCSGGNCTMDSFGTGETTIGSGGGTNTCDPVADTKCNGFSVESISASACKSFCAAK